MKAETIKNIFNFLKEKEGKEIPYKWGFIHKLETYPDGIQYKHNGNLILLNRNITKLPNDLYVDGVLNLWGCKQLTKLPDKLHVTQSLTILRTSIEELPDNLYVGGSLYMANTPLADKYTDEEIREMITSKGGTLIGKIYR
jgi:hypothetical protein